MQEKHWGWVHSGVKVKQTETRQRVLIVDDEPANIKILGAMLKNDYRVIIATNGKEAIELARSAPPPNLILMDIVMPGMNGYDACESLKADEKTQDIPVILMSGGNEEDDEGKGLRLGAVDFMAKPFSAVAVKARIKTHLELKRYRDLFEKGAAVRRDGADAVFERHCRTVDRGRPPDAADRRVEEKAAAAGRAKGELLAKISAEIRKPMNDIVGMINRLLDTDLGKDQRAYAEGARTASDLLLSIVNDISDFAWMETEGLKLQAFDFDLRMTLEDIVRMLTVRASGRGLLFNCVIGHEVPSFVRGDPGRLKQILINLVSSVMDATGKGMVCLQVATEEETASNVALRFAVTDSALGAPERGVACSHNDLSETDESMGRRYGGTELGLAIAKRLSELIGGRMEVETELGKHSTIWFTVVLERQQKRSAKDIADHGDISGRRVLIVDDNAVDRGILIARLKSCGCIIDEAAGGNEALQKLSAAFEQGDPFHVALIDMHMPGLNGDKLGQRIMADPALRDTAMVMLSSTGQRGDAAYLKDIGFCGYLNKPVDHRVLRDCLMMAVAMKRDEYTPFITRYSLEEACKRRMRILLAEQDSATGEIIVRYLENFGYRADTVFDGKAALKALETISYDLVLIDALLPGLDCLEAAGLVRGHGSRPSNRDTAVVLLAADAGGWGKEMCMEAGIDECISVPVKPDDLLETVRRVASTYRKRERRSL